MTPAEGARLPVRYALVGDNAVTGQFIAPKALSPGSDASLGPANAGAQIGLGVGTFDRRPSALGHAADERGLLVGPLPWLLVVHVKAATTARGGGYEFDHDQPHTFARSVEPAGDEEK